ncbi:MAG: succinate dehydrogenase cytochrome b subunit [Bacteroidales bacterium]
MGNILTSSVGKKIVMSLTGLFLILFLVIHLLANSAYLLNEEAFDAVIQFMGTPLVVAMVPVLALGFALHIIFSIYLTTTNLIARGKERYKVANKAETDSWASKNMFVLGVIVLGGLVIHLTHFWANMQYPQFFGGEIQDANRLMIQTFGNTPILILYLVWFAALWFHLTHGFWSAFHTIGANNAKWIGRLKVISYIYATLIFIGFGTIAVYAHLKAIGTIL